MWISGFGASANRLKMSLLGPVLACSRAWARKGSKWASWSQFWHVPELGREQNEVWGKKKVKNSILFAYFAGHVRKVFSFWHFLAGRPDWALRGAENARQPAPEKKKLCVFHYLGQKKILKNPRLFVHPRQNVRKVLSFWHFFALGVARGRGRGTKLGMGQ